MTDLTMLDFHYGTLSSNTFIRLISYIKKNQNNLSGNGSNKTCDVSWGLHILL